MTKSKWMMVLGATACGLILSLSVVAQQGTATQTATQPRFTASAVALVDVGYIISQNASIDTKMAAINDKYGKLIQDSAKDRQDITQLREKLATYDRNSDIYRETEQQMLTRVGELESKQLMIIKQGTEERLQVFNSVYTSIMNHSQALAKRYGMSIVMNYDRTKLLEQVPLLPNPQQYDAFFSQYAQAVATRPVVWANTGTVDLTSLVLNEIQKADPSSIRKANTTVKAQPARTNTAVGTQATVPATR